MEEVFDEMTVEEIAAEIAALVQVRHDLIQDGESGEAEAEEIKELRAELQRALVEGAEVCECGAVPVGIMQQATLGKRVVTIFEVGCGVESGKRAQGVTRELAVENWNAREFI